MGPIHPSQGEARRGAAKMTVMCRFENWNRYCQGEKKSFLDLNHSDLCTCIAKRQEKCIKICLKVPYSMYFLDHVARYDRASKSREAFHCVRSGSAEYAFLYSPLSFSSNAAPLAISMPKYIFSYKIY